MQENNKLYVGNLPYSVDDKALADMFTALEGVEVVEAKVITDKFSNRSKGFGFVTLTNDEMAQTAIAALNGKDIDGRPLTVNVARPKEERPNRDFRR